MYQFKRYGFRVLAFLDSSADMALNGLVEVLIELDSSLMNTLCSFMKYSCMDFWFIIFCCGLDQCLREFSPRVVIEFPYKFRVVGVSITAF